MTSTVVYKADEVHRMLGLVKSAKGALVSYHVKVELVQMANWAVGGLKGVHQNGYEVVQHIGDEGEFQ